MNKIKYQPELKIGHQRLLAVVVHCLGLFCLFVPGLCLWFGAQTRYPWLANQGRTAAKFQGKAGLAILVGASLFKLSGVRFARLKTATAFIMALRTEFATHPVAMIFFLIGMAIFGVSYVVWIAGSMVGAWRAWWYMNINSGVSDSQLVPWNMPLTGTKPRGFIPSALAALLIYGLVAGVLLLPPLWKSGPHSVLGPANADVAAFLWYYGWWPHAIYHGISPFISHRLWYPDGVNLAWTTSIPTPAILTAPLSTWLGPYASYNLIAFLSPVLAALFTFLLCFEMTDRFWPALIGGYILGFSAYEFRQLAGHIHLALMCFSPALAWLFVRRFYGRIGRWMYILLSALAWVLLSGVATEMLATTLFFAVICCGLAHIVWRDRTFCDRFHCTGREAILGFIIALGFILAVFAPYLLRGDNFGGFWSQGAYSLDAANLIVPTEMTWLGHAWLKPLWYTFAGKAAETGGYVGLPLLVLLASYFGEFGRRNCSRLLSLILAVIIVLAAGPQLKIFGQKLPIALPWYFLGKLPLLKMALPGRFMAFAWMAIAVITALWLAQSRRPVWIKAALVVLAIACLMPNIPGGYWIGQFKAPRFFTAGNYKRYLRPNETVLILPFGFRGDSMLYQMDSHYYFRMVDGYTGPTPTFAARSPALSTMLSRCVPSAAYGQQMLPMIKRHQVKAVIVVGKLRGRLARLAGPLQYHHLAGLGVWLARVPGTNAATGEAGHDQ